MTKLHYIELVWYKAVAELRAESARAYLGFIWWIIEPVLYMAAFYIVFGIIFQRGGDDFVPFLLCGLVIWKWFGSTVMNSTTAIPGNAGLMQQVYLPKFLLPSFVVVINTVKFLVVFGLLVIFLLIYGYSPTLNWLALPLLLGIQLMLIFGVSGLVSAIVPFVPDFRFLLDNILMLMFFLSGVFFDLGAVPEPLHSFVWLNPMAVLINEYRAVLLEGVWPDITSLVLVSVVAVVGSLLALYMLSRFDRIYPKVLI